MATRATSFTLAAALTIWLSPANPQADRDEESGVGRARPATLHVGADRELKRPSDAARIARDGDVIEIDAGTYDRDAAVWRQSRLTIRAAGGRVHLRADGAQVEGKGTWVFKGSNITIEGLEFSGAKVPDRNGAGVRLEGAGLTVRHCWFHDNENSILTRNDARSDILVERSEFSRNGSGDGQSHNLYVGKVRSFTMRFSYVHHAIVGHNVKSRALRSHVAYNRIMDESDGRSSYAVEFPEGGLVFILGNLIQQGPAAENPTILSYGAEGLHHPLNELHFVNNTVVNDRPAGGRFLFVRRGADAARIVNNVLVGRGQLLEGPGEQRHNVVAPAGDLVGAAVYDYRLRAGAAAIDRGTDPGTAHGLRLWPSNEYVHRAGGRRRPLQGALDAGALEYRRGR